MTRSMTPGVIGRNLKSMTVVNFEPPPLSPPPLPLDAKVPFLHGMYGGIVPEKPSVTARIEQSNEKTPESQRKFRVYFSQVFIIGALWDKRTRKLHILFPGIHIVIPFKVKETKNG